MDVSAYRGCGSARHMMPANAPKNSQPTMRSTPFDRPTLACLAGGPREWKNYSHMEILAMVLHNPYIRSSTTCSRSALQSLRSPSCLFDSFSMCIDLDLDPIDQPVCAGWSGAGAGARATYNTGSTFRATRVTTAQREERVLQSVVQRYSRVVVYPIEISIHDSDL